MHAGRTVYFSKYDKTVEPKEKKFPYDPLKCEWEMLDI